MRWGIIGNVAHHAEIGRPGVSIRTTLYARLRGRYRRFYENKMSCGSGSLGLRATYQSHSVTSEVVTPDLVQQLTINQRATTVRHPHLSTTMGKPVSEDIQWIVIRLSTAMSREDIAMYTGISHRKVNNILSTFNKYGSVKSTTRQKPHVYTSLCDNDIQVPPFHFLCTASITNQQYSICVVHWRQHQTCTLMSYVKNLNCTMGSQSRSQQSGEHSSVQGIL